METIDELTVSPSIPGRLAAHGHYVDEGIEITLAGQAEIAESSSLGNLLRLVHTRALHKNAQRVLVDWTDLKFMSSACFKQFVTWMSLIEQTEPARRYKVQIKSSPTHRWQRTSLHALTAFAIGTLSFE